MDNNNANVKQEEREQMIELGSDITKSSKGNIYTLTIIGQVEGHQVLPENAKTTKYEHVLPLLAGIEESEDIDGLLLLLNTVGGDIEAGLAIANDCWHEEAYGVFGVRRRTLYRYSFGGVH